MKKPVNELIFSKDLQPAVENEGEVKKFEVSETSRSFRALPLKLSQNHQLSVLVHTIFELFFSHQIQNIRRN